MEVLNENIPDKVFENVSLHSSLESLEENHKSEDEFPDSAGEKLAKSKRNSLKKFFFKKNEEPSEEVKKDGKSKFGSLGRRIYSKSPKPSEFASTIPKREHGQMNLVEGSPLDGPPKQKSLTNLRSAVSLYWQSIFSKKKGETDENGELKQEDEPKDELNSTENVENPETGKILIDNS